MILGFVSDSHGCVEALDKALEILRHHGAQRVYHLGDSVGYFPGWRAADRLRELGVPSLLGNHEEMLLQARFDSIKDEMYRLAETRREGGAARLGWVEDLPRTLSVEEGGSVVMLVHGSLSDPVWEYVYPDTPLDGFDPSGAEAVVMGHTHRPCLRRCKGVRFMNAGSCALPRDEEGLGAVCLWDTETGEGQILRFTVGLEVRLAAGRTRVHPGIRERIEALPA